MIAPLLGRTLRQQGPLLLCVSAGLALFEAVLIWAAAQIEAGPGFRALVSQLPAQFQEVIGSYLGVMSFAAAVALGFQHPVTLAAAAAIVIVLATIPAGERDAGLLDLIQARPLPRRVYLAAPLAAVAIASAALPLALLAGAAGGLAAVEPPGERPISTYLIAALELAALLLCLGGVSLLLACGARRRGRAVAQAAGLILAAYVLEFVAEARHGLVWIRWISPFHYFKPIPAAVLSQWTWRDPLVLLGIAAAASALAFARYERRDL